MKSIAIAINASLSQVEAAVGLLDEGATVPFIARYRKEVTGGLSDEQLRDLVRLLKVHRALEARRVSILKSLKTAGIDDAKILSAIKLASTKIELETLYAPFKSTRKTKADQAREKGYEPVARALASGRPISEAVSLVKGKVDLKEVEAGAREIVIDEIARDVTKISRLAKSYEKEPLTLRAVRGKKDEAQVWLDKARPESAQTMAGHRALGLFRAMREGVIAFELDPSQDPGRALTAGLGSSQSAFLKDVGQEAWKGRVGSALKGQVLETLRVRAELEATSVFKKNLKDLLLAAPAGPRTILGLDPGLRTGIKAAVIDGTGKVLKTLVFNPLRDGVRANRELLNFSKVDLIALGNGTGSREAQAWVSQVFGKSGPRVVVVSEAGASVYSASALASREFPDMDVSLRGAVSIARRLQDPLAELVKIDPKSLGVGQYQHDVDEGLLKEALDGVVQDAVSAVGVDANTASAALLSHVPGIGSALAEKIVIYRNEKGPFVSRAALKKVPGLGAKAFEQAAGFLRIFGKNPLDATAVHPESYAVAEEIARKVGLVVADALGSSALASVRASDIVVKGVAASVVEDVLEEMRRPGRDPRPQFRTARLEEAVTTIDDLKVGMRLEGTVSNVAAFGAFVDLGVHQDGLVHVSQMSEEFVSDPSSVVSVGDVVRVRVLDVDKEKNRISLSMKPERIEEKKEAGRSVKSKTTPKQKPGHGRRSQEERAGEGGSNDSPFAALSALKRK